MALKFDTLYRYTERNVKRALQINEGRLLAEASSIEFPGYYRMKPGDFRTSIFATVFLDIRGSTERAMLIGPQKTYVTIHALLPTLAKIVDEMDGFVVDYPGDGIMAHWELDTESDKSTLYSCIEACSYMDDAVKTIINPLLIQYGVPPIVCGIGASVGNVIVTKLGIPSFVTAKAIGNSINRAAKLASANLNSGVILIDKTILDRAYTVVPSDHPGPSAFKFLQTQEQTIEISPNIKLERTPLANNLLEYLNRLGVK